MRFMARSLLGLALLGATLAILAVAAGNILTSVKERQARADRQRPATERVFPVTVGTIEPVSVAPVITAYGEVESWRELELRSTASGTLIEIADNFRDGGAVEEGELLVRIDPADALAALELAATQVKEAEAELLEARAALKLAEAELQAAVEQTALRQAALTRQEDLRRRGVGSDSAVETASLALSSARQTNIAREQALAEAQARILRAEIGLDRQEIARAEAERRLAETEMRAPFSGILSDVAAVAGRQVNANEQLGVLIDPDALEVAFRVSNAQFARLVDARGALRPVGITATLDLDGAPISVTGRLDRAGASVGEGQTGRLLYARLDAGEGRVLRPGDFMSVDIREPMLEGVAVVPATAATSAGRMLFVGEGERLEEVAAEILRRQADSLIVSGVPAGRDYVLRLQPQLGAGVKVKASRPGGGIVEAQTIRLDEARRARLIAFVEANDRMPAEAKARVLERLKAEEVPAETVARLEERMGGDAQPAASAPAPVAEAASTIALDPERRARLIAFVEANDRMPAEARARALESLKADEVPAALVERLEGRMGG